MKTPNYYSAFVILAILIASQCVNGQNSNQTRQNEQAVPDRIITADEKYHANIVLQSGINHSPGALPHETLTDENSDSELFEKGIMDARAYYHGHKTAGMATLFGTSLILPIGIVSAIDQSSAGFKEDYPQELNSLFLSNPGYQKGYSSETLKMRRKSVRKNLLIGAAIQAVIVTGVTTAVMNSGNRNITVGMSGM